MIKKNILRNQSVYLSVQIKYFVQTKSYVDDVNNRTVCITENLFTLQKENKILDVDWVIDRKDLAKVNNLLDKEYIKMFGRILGMVNKLEDMKMSISLK